jgi:hypothetical protein
MRERLRRSGLNLTDSRVAEADQILEAERARAQVEDAPRDTSKALAAATFKARPANTAASCRAGDSSRRHFSIKR